MKKSIFYLIANLLILNIVACGSSGRSLSTAGDPATNLTTSIEAIGDILDYAQIIVNSCPSVSPGVIRCDCANGGTVTITDSGNGSGSFLFNSCVDEIDQLFIGEISTVSDGTTTFSFDRAAYCNDVNSTISGANCSGTLEATCREVASTCTFQNSGGACRCL